MGTKDGARARKRRNGTQRLRYFFVDDELHKTIYVNRPQDLLVAWNYPQEKRVAFVYSHVRKHHGKAFDIAQVCKMLNRSRLHLWSYIAEGHIPRPSQTYTLDGRKKPGIFKFSEKDIYGIHEYLLTVHRGRPRKDGQITPHKVPSRAELRAMIENDVVLYVKNSDGEFVPVWKEADW